MMRASIRMAVTRFSAERMVRDYFDHLYRTPEGVVRRNLAPP